MTEVFDRDDITQVYGLVLNVGEYKGDTNPKPYLCPQPYITKQSAINAGLHRVSIDADVDSFFVVAGQVSWYEKLYDYCKGGD